MPVLTPGGRALGLNLQIPHELSAWRIPLSPRSNPPPHDIDLRPKFTHAIRDQGQEGSCTGQAGVTCAEWLFSTAGRPLSLSAAMLYFTNRRMDNTPTSQDAGASSISIGKSLAQFGCCDEGLMPYVAGQYAQGPNTAAYANALQHKITSYYQATGDLLGAVWAILMEGWPCCIGFQVPQSFETRVGSDGRVPVPGGVGDTILGGHEMVIWGWSNALASVGCRNSWGQGFGMQGDLWMPKEYFDQRLVMDITVLHLDGAVPWVPAPPTPTPTPTTGPKALVQDARGLVQQNLDYAPGVWVPGTLEQAAHDLDTALPGIPDDSPVPPTPTPTKFAMPLGPGAVIGKTKWATILRQTPASGCDMFTTRGATVYAPADCVVEEVLGGVGVNGGAEIILALPDKSWAWRYRHNGALPGESPVPGTHALGFQLLPGVHVGSAVIKGQAVAKVGDTSLDRLGPIPTWAQQQAGGPFPDGWQHLDLSVNKGTDRFAPAGGGGGNVDAYQWLMDNGYQPRAVLERTPGPPDAGRGWAHAVELTTPFGR